MNDDDKFTPVNPSSDNDYEDPTDDWDGVDWELSMGLTSLSDIDDSPYFD